MFEMRDGRPNHMVLRPRPSSPSRPGVDSKLEAGWKLLKSLTHTSDSEDKCQLVVKKTGRISLRRTTVGKSER
jgi:hypothetical protein